MLKNVDDPQYRAVLEAMPDGIYILDRNLLVSYVNPAIKHMVEGFGLTSDIIGRVFTKAFPFTGDYLEKEVARIFETRQPMESENTYTINGRPIVSAAKRIPIFNDQGVMFAVLNVIRDVTQERAAARDLVLTKGRLEEMVEDSGSIMLKMDTEARVTYWNRYAEQFFGFSRDELLGKTLSEPSCPGWNPRAAICSNSCRRSLKILRNTPRMKMKISVRMEAGSGSTGPTVPSLTRRAGSRSFSAWDRTSPP